MTGAFHVLRDSGVYLDEYKGYPTRGSDTFAHRRHDRATGVPLEGLVAIPPWPRLKASLDKGKLGPRIIWEPFAHNT